MGKLRPMAVLRIVSVPAAVWAIYYLKGNICFRLYPVAVVAFVFAFFLISLFRTPAVEVFARRMGEAIDDRVKEYCRKVTLVWVGFLAVHFLMTLATVFASYEIWAVYNGFVAYVLMGILFVGEWLVRRRIRRG
jgi:uncharacterized membrane protein